MDAFAGRGDSHRACEHNPRVTFNQLTATLKNGILSWLRSINLVKGFSTLQLVISVQHVMKRLKKNLTRANLRKATRGAAVLTKFKLDF